MEEREWRKDVLRREVLRRESERLFSSLLSSFASLLLPLYSFLFPLAPETRFLGPVECNVKNVKKVLRLVNCIRETRLIEATAFLT